MSAFAKKLKYLRVKNNLKQSELSSILGFGKRRISLYESEWTKPLMKDIIKIADYFHVSVDFLISDDVEK